MVRNILAVVMIAVGYFGIAIIGCGFDKVQFVAVTRAHFLIPQLAFVIKAKPQRVAMAERPDLRLHRIGSVVKRIICRHSAIGE